MYYGYLIEIKLIVETSTKDEGGGKRLIISANMDGNGNRPPPGTGCTPVKKFLFVLNGYIFDKSGHGRRGLTNLPDLLNGFIDFRVTSPVCCVLDSSDAILLPIRLELVMSLMPLLPWIPDAMDALVMAKLVASTEPLLSPWGISVVKVLLFESL